MERRGYIVQLYKRDQPILDIALNLNFYFSNMLIVGVWVANEPREGTFTAPDGTVYEGQWEFRERNGQGTLVYADGKTVEGEFKDGDLVGK